MVESYAAREARFRVRRGVERQGFVSGGRLRNLATGEATVTWNSSPSTAPPARRASRCATRRRLARFLLVPSAVAWCSSSLRPVGGRRTIPRRRAACRRHRRARPRFGESRNRHPPRCPFTIRSTRPPRCFPMMRHSEISPLRRVRRRAVLSAPPLGASVPPNIIQRVRRQLQTIARSTSGTPRTMARR